jgi:hypothetical protein
MRAAPHAGSSRRRSLRAISALLGLVLGALALLGHSPSPHVEQRAIASASPETAAAVPAGPNPPYDDAGYLAYADRLQQRLSPMWDERRGMYIPGDCGCAPLVNAGLLLTHSVAAQAGHDGPTRNDRRARRIVKALVSPPAFIDRRPHNPPAGSQIHWPGWSNTMLSSGGQHLVYDAEVVDGLVHAWKARNALGLSDELADKIADRIHRVATSRFWRWPTIRLNQINWYALIYAADADVTGRSTMLRHDLRLQLERFVAGADHGPDGGPGNFGPGLRFHYLPHRPLNSAMNVDSTEYANIVMSFSRFYGRARAGGMPPVRGAQRTLLRQWVKRVLTGYWTHSGYPSWDSGLGFDRWHQAKKLGLSQQALIGIAQSRELQPSPAYGRWAKWILDRGLAWYERQPVRAGRLPDPVFFRLSQVPQTLGSARLAAVRTQSNAARALAAGLGRLAAAEPPPLYAYDPDTGRLAVTTRAYNTAIVPVSQHAFPYGGIELARLFDGEQHVVANVGGRGTAAFGVRLRDAAGRVALDSQRPRAAVSSTVTPLRLTRAPSGVGARASAPVGRAYAGSFKDLRASGRVASAAGSVTSAYRFTARAIDATWTVTRAGTAGPLSAGATFPSWGRRGRIVAVLRDGSRRRVTGRPLALREVERFEVRSAHSGYVVIPAAMPGSATVRAVRPAAQSSAPAPGPSLCVMLARRARFGRVRLAVRIIPELSRTVETDSAFQR